MMTIIRTAAELAAAGYLIFLSVRDIRTKKVTNRSLLFMLPIAVLRILPEVITGAWGTVFSHVLGGVSGFGLLLLAAMLTGNGIGGGDIRLAGILGCISGFGGTVLLLLSASLTASLWGLGLYRLRGGGTALNIPFVPFMTAGYLFAVTVTHII